VGQRALPTAGRRCHGDVKRGDLLELGGCFGVDLASYGVREPDQPVVDRPRRERQVAGCLLDVVGGSPERVQARSPRGELVAVSSSQEVFSGPGRLLPSCDDLPLH